MILNDVVKEATGFIISDWKAVYSWDYVMKRLDQHSGTQVDQQQWFDKPLRQA